jgi:hypothetical protein
VIRAESVVLGRTEFVRALFWMMLSMLALGACTLIAAWRLARGIARREMVFWSVVAAGCDVDDAAGQSTALRARIAAPGHSIPMAIQRSHKYRHHRMVGIALDAMSSPLGRVQRNRAGLRRGNRRVVDGVHGGSAAYHVIPTTSCGWPADAGLDIEQLQHA